MQNNGYARVSLNDLDDPRESIPEENDNPKEVKIPLRPHIYYDEGPFDAPSSESEDETLLEKDAPTRGQQGYTLDSETGYSIEGIHGQRKRPNSLRCLLIILASLVGVAILIGIFAAFTYTGSAFAPVRGTRPLTMDHVFNGTFHAQHAALRWIPEAGDGVYAEQDFGRSTIVLVDLKTNTTRDLVNLADVKNEQGNPIGIAEWKLSRDMGYLLFKTDYQKQWRHSSFGNYYVHDIEAKSTYPLISPSHPPETAYAAWSPVGDAIAYVHKNDLYIKPNAAPSTRAIRLTASGSETHFNGVPDWVYEEEVFSDEFALWWSPDAKRLAFLESDETEVDVYTFPIYNPSMDAHGVYPYTEDVAMRYPKPGFTNPSVDVHVFDLDGYLSSNPDEDEDDEDEDDDDVDDEVPDEITQYFSRLTWSPRRAAGESIVFDVTWIGDNDLLVKEVNRAADDGVVVHFRVTDLSIASAEVQGSIVRRLGRDGEEGDNGWIESRQTISPLSPSLVSTLGYSSSAYLDLVNNSAGYTHVALFSPADSSEPVFVTDGEWEVVDGILGVDAQGIVYLAATYASSIERAIVAARIPSLSSAADENRITQLNTLTDTSIPAWYEASFSPEAGYYLLSYRGPNVPWQSVFSTSQEDFEYKVVENAQLNVTLSEYQSPLILRSAIENDGFELNTMELLPPNFDNTGRTKYPVLFRVYGGPGSQMVHTRFERDWHAYLACTLKYIIVIVDGRGTGFKGRALRNPIRGNLGYWETRDQIEAARVWASKPYVDPKRIGIWGWSYGGFMSSKIAEADEGVHSLAMAVAPVTSWRLYDSIYTERYMSTPELNPSGYDNASISNVTGFRNVNYLLAHGSGDDNVHFANSAHLLDMLTQEKVRGFRFRMFTDSDHSINRRGAYRELHEFMTEFLLEKWGMGGTRRRWS